MNTKYVDSARKLIIRDLTSTSSWQSAWVHWLPLLKAAIPTPTADEIIGLGGKLATIFASSKDLEGEARAQSQLSASGYLWEGILCFYLNLSLIGTSTVAYKKRSHVPKSICDALAVGYGNVWTNAESDLIVVTFPEDGELDEVAPPNDSDKAILNRLSDIAEDRYGDLRVTVIQCKTNWNDNAQIPMLWDMIYRGDFTNSAGVVVGRNGRSPKHLKSLRYAFATMPSNKLEGYSATSLPVKRVSELTGGNYWGNPGRKGIAQSVNEIFPKAKIGPDEGIGIRASLARALPRLSTEYAYFGL